MKALINEAIETPRTYLDYEKLTSDIQAGADPTKTGMAQYIDVARLV